MAMVEKTMGADDAKQCPWCQRWCLKDNACDYIFSCGLDFKGKFNVNNGCGRSWCWGCGKKYCSQYHNPETGEKLGTAKDQHDGMCCRQEVGFVQEDYCPGGHSAHCPKRF